jgi:hypothetical protein
MKYPNKEMTHDSGCNAGKTSVSGLSTEQLLVEDDKSNFGQTVEVWSTE